MNYLHYEVRAKKYNRIKVSLSGTASVRLMDPLNYHRYKLGRSVKAKDEIQNSRAEFEVPYDGTWHVIVDLGGKRGDVKAIVDIIKE